MNNLSKTNKEKPDPPTLKDEILFCVGVLGGALFIYQAAVFHANHAMYPPPTPENRIKLFGRWDW